MLITLYNFQRFDFNHMYFLCTYLFKRPLIKYLGEKTGRTAFTVKKVTCAMFLDFGDKFHRFSWFLRNLGRVGEEAYGASGASIIVKIQFV